MTTVFAVAIPWDAYSASGVQVFSTRDKAQTFCDRINASDDVSYRVSVTECAVQ